MVQCIILEKAYIKDTSTWDENKFKINVYDIHYPEGWWISVCKESDLKEFFKYYDIVKDKEALKAEINFEKGIHKEKIQYLIEVARKHLYNAK